MKQEFHGDIVLTCMTVFVDGVKILKEESKAKGVPEASFEGIVSDSHAKRQKQGSRQTFVECAPD